MDFLDLKLHFITYFMLLITIFHILVPPKSTLWKHFIKGSEGAKCNVCQQFIKTSGNTTNLRYHLQRKHSDLCNTKMVTTSDESREWKEMVIFLNFYII